MTQPIISVSDVSFAYNQQVVLEDINFKIQAGEFVGVIGPNGSGKTTLLKVLLGLLKPDQGQVQLFGKPVKVGQHPQIGYIPQRVTQAETRFPITVEEVVSLGRVKTSNILQRFSSADQEVITSALSAVDLLPFRQRLITDLSGGQQQRVFIAKALAGQPQLLILDEPTVGIDVESQESFYQLLATLNQEKCLTVVLVSHDIDVVVNEVDSVLCLNKRLVYHGNTKEFIKHDYLKRLYGDHHKFIYHAH